MLNSSISFSFYQKCDGLMSSTNRGISETEREETKNKKQHHSDTASLRDDVIDEFSAARLSSLNSHGNLTEPKNSDNSLISYGRNDDAIFVTKSKVRIAELGNHCSTDYIQPAG